MKILSIDGGGIRGILPGQILVALEQKIQGLEGNKEARLGEYFDMVAGTSTGALLSAAYVCPDENLRPKFSAEEAVDFYLEDGDEIFKAGFWRSLLTLGGLLDEKYAQKELEGVLETAFGETKLSELLKPTCLVSYDITSRSPIIFTQHNCLEKRKDFLVRDVLRGSTAAPTYFEAVKISSITDEATEHTLIDGGIVANDPTLCAYSEALKFNNVNGIKDMMIVSIGTGRELKEYAYDKVKNLGRIGWAKPVMDISLESGAQMTDYHMRKIASTMPNTKYFRIEPSLDKAEKSLDDASDKNLKALKEAGTKSALLNDEILDEIARYLVESVKKT